MNITATMTRGLLIKTKILTNAGNNLAVKYNVLSNLKDFKNKPTQHVTYLDDKSVTWTKVSFHEA